MGGDCARHQVAGECQASPGTGHAAGARGAVRAGLARGAGPNDKNPSAAGTSPAKPGRDREALGWSRGGLTTKVHLVADRRCSPVTDILTPGQQAHCPQFIQFMDQISVRWRGTGRPRTWPGTLAG